MSRYKEIMKSIPAKKITYRRNDDKKYLDMNGSTLEIDIEPKKVKKNESKRSKVR